MLTSNGINIFVIVVVIEYPSRIYKLQSGCARGVTYSVGSILRNVSGISFDKYEKGKYILSRATVNKIIDLLN